MPRSCAAASPLSTDVAISIVRRIGRSPERSRSRRVSPWSSSVTTYEMPCDYRIVQGDDVGMVQSGRRLRFALEPLARGVVLRQRGGQDFDRDRPSQARVMRAVDLAHATGSNQRVNDVRTEDGA